MRKIAITLTVLSLCVVGTWSIPAAAETDRGTASQWVQRPSLHHPRSGLGVATANGRIFAIGGFFEGFDVPASSSKPDTSEAGGRGGTWRRSRRRGPTS